MTPFLAVVAAVAAHASWHQLPLSNGYAAAVYDAERARVTSLREHVYARPDATSTTRELLYDAYFGLRSAGVNTWLGESPVDEAGWDDAVPGAGIAQVVQHAGDLRATERYFAPFGADAPALVAVVTVTNAGAAPLHDAALFSLHNLHVGGGADGTLGESIVWQGDGFEERGEGARVVLVRPLGTLPTHHAATPANPYTLVESGARLVDTDASGRVDDAVSGFEWDLEGLAPGESRSFGLVLAVAPGGDRAGLDAALAPLVAAAATDGALAVLAEERAGWSAFFARAHEPAGLSDDERAVYRRQLAILRMAQVREPDGTSARPHGQIVASLPPGGWNITWVRDQAYAVRALTRAGLFAEARAALAFVLGGHAGAYAGYLGTPYALSVCRYFGNGDEESDADADGPNIELDGFGLTLGVLAEYVEASGDATLVDTFAGAIFARTADVLVHLVGTDGLVAADSSIWERHWEHGGRQRFAYTQATATWGLRAAARLAEARGANAAASAYAATADTIAAALAARLVDGATGVLRASFEQTTSYLDGAVVEAFDLDVLPAAGAVALATLDALRAGLWIDATGQGYRRNDDGGEYDQREWIVVDLRLAQALRRAGREAAADALLAWVTAQARQNLDLVPENFDPTSGDFAGAVPMAGFGAGAYVLALHERAEAEVPPGGEPDAGVVSPGADAGVPEVPPGRGGDGGCGCHVADPVVRGGASGLAMILVVLVFVFVGERQRRSGRR